MCNETKPIKLPEECRASILRIAPVRRKEAIKTLVDSKNYTLKTAEAKNELGNHIAGEVTEIAVSAWLKESGVPNTRPNSVREEMDGKLPDIECTQYSISLDVKSTIGTVPSYQLGKPKSKAVVWCATERGEFDRERDYNTTVPLNVRILGWSTIEDFFNYGYEHNGESIIHKYQFRCLTSLLEWLKTGVLPAADWCKASE
jgi:hypothetical protein